MRIAAEIKIPNSWYNIIPDLDFDIPPMMGSSGFPLSYHDLQYLAPSSIIDQELAGKERDIPVPRQVRDKYSNRRPTPLYRAEKL